MYLNHSLTIFLICCSTSYGFLRTGSCPFQTGVDNFDLARFSGLWYEVRAQENIHLTTFTFGTCLSIQFEASSIQNIGIMETNHLTYNYNPANYTRIKTIISTYQKPYALHHDFNADFIPNTSIFKVHQHTPCKEILNFFMYYYDHQLLRVSKEQMYYYSRNFLFRRKQQSRKKN